MASFDIAYSMTSHNEGGYQIDTNGYPVYKGINREFYPAWEGWKFIDKIKPAKKQVIPEIEYLVTSFYKKYYWEKYNLETIKIQELANFSFDALLQHGKARVIFNRAFGWSDSIKFSKKHIDFMNAVTDPTALLNSLCDIRLKYALANTPSHIHTGIRKRVNRYRVAISQAIANATEYLLPGADGKDIADNFSSDSSSAVNTAISFFFITVLVKSIFR